MTRRSSRRCGTLFAPANCQQSPTMGPLTDQLRLNCPPEAFLVPRRPEPGPAGPCVIPREHERSKFPARRQGRTIAYPLRGCAVLIPGSRLQAPRRASFAPKVGTDRWGACCGGYPQPTGHCVTAPARQRPDSRPRSSHFHNHFIRLGWGS